MRSPRILCIAMVPLAICVTTSVAADPASPNQAEAVKVVKNVSYLGEDRQEKLDLYLPAADDGTPRPAVVIVHGGGWHGGDKAARREQNIGNNLAAAGYVCASINYRLCEKNPRIVPRLREVWPGNLHDCRTAVRFLRKHAEKYSIDTKHIGAIGGSAGGHLVGMMAVIGDKELPDTDGLYREFSSRIQAVVPMYGVHDLLVVADRKGESLSTDEKELCKQASAVNWITPDDPPALILHGTKDALVPVKQSQILHDRLTAAKLPSQLIIVKGAPHSFHLQPKQRDLRATVIEFFHRHLKPAKK